jgi:GNAT superfamily N-acetyltransferase
MNIRLLDAKDISSAAELSLRMHESLRLNLPFLPPRRAEDLAQRLHWILDNGKLLGLFDGPELAAFLGGFRLDDFRNAGPGFYSPDWCHGHAAGIPAAEAYRPLYRELATVALSLGCRIHALSVYASELETTEVFSLSGFGRIVLDAALPAVALAKRLVPERQLPINIRRATPVDAATLSNLQAELAAHIGASPILMPNARGADRDEWAEWLADGTRISLLAETRDGAPLGFIKAEAPQFDVSYSVHADSTLAINGMYVKPQARRGGTASALLTRLTAYGLEWGKSLISVDCETTNPEAFAFWTKYFTPVTWSMERRV